jgi:hypothetical protein
MSEMPTITAADQSHEPSKSRRRRGLFVVLLICICVGLILNWPIAWGIRTKFVTLGAQMNASGLCEHSTWPASAPKDWPPLSTFITPERVKLAKDADSGAAPLEVAARIGATQERPRDCIMTQQHWPGVTETFIEAHEHEKGSWTTYELASGFPFRGVVAGAFGSQTADGKAILPMTAIKPVLVYHIFGKRITLAAPLWPGFIANGVIYGVVLWLPWLLFVTIRARVRRSKGYCMQCAYPIPQATSQCPECGAIAVT